ncbi:galactose-6-phosphate isomerase subunit LacB [Mammaliicoccus sciuri]|uniref:galactose-6-phosphate isomerase subunit LacB n=1 Tax=Mammaliicoccus sciuri TaxID=1296 RepID=UPI00195283E3|nr:galactose-6-phosphate isomerase subunit LacB [Mammaliicoccus sciuri]MBU6088009.1 galactose-6-phosphate isomerase subunit LacB [Mammaliicoccus sciuri]MEB6263102.1 galactose-6-phosphate isomerase subunit LacB [Mammaliicoccus sciuri]MEB6291960.1 galactose-6-phosphate isomerase subunit LacB [Mammaliicoccus sciuri]WQK56750.1 galactose-6-phosphate isomerase subunit LacB [Mammaliicoccus sciuri]WQK70137.1 galactose-6-phosphate isomerase subunit LacB [Mammaliicoccus sciuri]
MKIAIGCDHIVTDEKIKVSDFIKSIDHEVIDVGTYDHQRTHYPIYGVNVSKAVTEGKADLGVVLCGTGVGISVSANKVPNARVALVRDITSARLAKEKYNCNIIGVGGTISGIDLITDIVETFINAEYIQTTESDQLIERMNQLLTDDQVQYDSNQFNKYIDKCNKGEYVDEVKH